jgi:hypothetical protein
MGYSTPLLDPFGRRITNLRVSVTDKCNFRCTYCMPEEGIALKSHNDILRLEQIAEVVRAAATLGISKIKLTGGEPLVRRNIESLVAMIAAIPGIADFGMTTNGSLLTPETARRLNFARYARSCTVFSHYPGRRRKRRASRYRRGDRRAALAGENQHGGIRRYLGRRYRCHAGILRRQRSPPPDNRPFFARQSRKPWHGRDRQTAALRRVQPSAADRRRLSQTVSVFRP